MNRRLFLRQSCLGVAAVALQPHLAARASVRTPGSNDRLRLGLVGFSDRARAALIPAIQHLSGEHNCEIVAVSDLWNRRRDEAVAYFSTRYGQNIAAYRNNEEMYAAAKLDAVIISTADFQHALHTIEAVEAGCDVYVEKPFAETMADARDALAAVRRSQRIVQVGSQRRSGRNYGAAHDYLRSGQFGDIVAVEMTWNVNQPGRWRRPELVAALREEDTDWRRFLLNRPFERWDPRKYLEYRLFWPYSSGIPGQWMCHQIDTVHWFTGLPHPRSVTAQGGIYQWQDGRTNSDTLTAVFDYGPLDDPRQGFQVVYSSRFSNSAGGMKEIYYSNGGELNLETNEVTDRGGLEERHAAPMNLPARRIAARQLERNPPSPLPGLDSMTVPHLANWLQCIRTRAEPNAPAEAGYQHSIATIMATAAAHTGERATFDVASQNVLVGGRVFHL